MCETQKVCCLCGSTKNVYNNPEPLRDGGLDCCDACNLLVRTARIRYGELPEGEKEQYIRRLQGMTYAELQKELQEERLE